MHNEKLVKPGLPLQSYTPARVGLPRTGSAIGTRAQLAFQLDHALARDAVHDTVDFATLLFGLRERGFEPLMLESAVTSREEYLRRPDLGRRLSEAYRALLTGIPHPPAKPALSIIIADGLSARAIDRHALPLLDALTPLLPADSWLLSPVCLVRNGRVAIGDEIGSLLGARLSLLLIGERPGLSAPDSLGAYLTWNPRAGRTDADRNCISNIRLQGLTYAEAARRILFYMNAARTLGASGFALKAPASPNLPRIG